MIFVAGKSPDVRSNENHTAHHVVAKVPGLDPVDIGGLAGKSPDVRSNENHTAHHDDGQGLKSDMVPQRSKVHALHFADLVVWHSSTLAHEHGVICSLKHLGQKHLGRKEISCRSESSNKSL